MREENEAWSMTIHPESKDIGKVDGNHGRRLTSNRNNHNHHNHNTTSNPLIHGSVVADLVAHSFSA